MYEVHENFFKHKFLLNSKEKFLLKSCFFNKISTKLYLKNNLKIFDKFPSTKAMKFFWSIFKYSEKNTIEI